MSQTLAGPPISWAPPTGGPLGLIPPMTSPMWPGGQAPIQMFQGHPPPGLPPHPFRIAGPYIPPVSGLPGIRPIQPIIINPNEGCYHYAFYEHVAV